MDKVYESATLSLQALLMEHPELLEDSRKLKNMVADYIHDKDVKEALCLLIDIGFVQKIQTSDSKTKIIKTAEKSIKEVRKKSTCPLDSIYMSANFLYKVIKIEKDDLLTFSTNQADTITPHWKPSMPGSSLFEGANRWALLFIILIIMVFCAYAGISQHKKTQIANVSQQETKKENTVQTQEVSHEITASELYQQGKDALETKNYSEALEKLTMAAEAGSTEAMNSLGDMYCDANGVDLDYDKAVDWYRKASNLGNMEATKNLGRMYRTGHGVEKNYVKAFELFKNAVNGGNAAAMREIGYLYHFGYGVPIDYTKAMNWYSKAAKAGDAEAYERIGVMYEFGRGVEKDYDRAVSYYQKADSNGSYKGTRRLGLMYEMGKGVQQNYHKAMELYQRAADNGSVSALNDIGGMYAQGAGVGKDESEAVIWFRKAAEKGDDFGMRNLGCSYLNGMGVPQRYSEALYWLKKSAKEGCADAMNDLGYMYDHGYGVDYNRNEAIKWFKKAAAKGHEQAKENLRKMGETQYTDKGCPAETQKQLSKRARYKDGVFIYYPYETQKQLPKSEKVKIDAQNNVQEEARRRREENLRRIKQNNSENETDNKSPKGGYMSEFKFSDRGYTPLPMGVVAMSGTLTGIKSSCEGLRDIPSPKGNIVYRTTGNERNVMITHHYNTYNERTYPKTGEWYRVWCNGNNKTYVGWVHLSDVDQ